MPVKLKPFSERSSSDASVCAVNVRAAGVIGRTRGVVAGAAARFAVKLFGRIGAAVLALAALKLFLTSFINSVPLSLKVILFFVSVGGATTIC
jgi:hypothetical protein